MASAPGARCTTNKAAKSISLICPFHFAKRVQVLQMENYAKTNHLLFIAIGRESNTEQKQAIYSPCQALDRYEYVRVRI